MRTCECVRVRAFVSSTLLAQHTSAKFVDTIAHVHTETTTLTPTHAEPFEVYNRQQSATATHARHNVDLCHRSHTQTQSYSNGNARKQTVPFHFLSGLNSFMTAKPECKNPP